MTIMTKTIYLFGLFLILQSCNSTKLIPLDKRALLDQSNLTSINGRYDNNSDDTLKYQRTTIWAHLKPFYNDTNLNKTAYQQIPNSYIKIEIIDKNKIQFNRYDSETLKESKVFPFKVKDGVILIKSGRNKRMEGIPLLFFRQHSETLNLALDKNYNLSLSFDGSASGGVFIIIFGTPIKGTHTFVKK